MDKQMNYDLKNKTIIITGANSGIGKAASMQLAGMGANVVMLCRSKERGEQALQDVWLAADSTLENISGGYWDAPNTPVKANKNAYKLETQQRLWDVSVKLAGL